MTSGPIRVLLVDDHPVVRAGYRRLFEGGGDIQVVAEAGSGEEGYRLFTEFDVDVVVMDLSMPGMGGLEAVRRMLSREPEAKTLVFSVHDNEAMLAQALRAGVRGYLTKQSAPQVMAEAIRRVAAGETFIDPLLADHVAEPGTEEAGPLAQLTPREFQVFRLLAEGYTVNEIARVLSISPKTAGVHHTRVMNKLEVRTPGQLVRLALRHGVITS
ncbi:MAG TPA: response regulator transcription factor [Gammaproteobacteria bacterium]|nr:response regulator transcription factor [Gammaproteobacteria bacterium]